MIFKNIPQILNQVSVFCFWMRLQHTRLITSHRFLWTVLSVSLILFFSSLFVCHQDISVPIQRKVLHVKANQVEFLRNDQQLFLTILFESLPPSLSPVLIAAVSLNHLHHTESTYCPISLNIWYISVGFFIFHIFDNQSATNHYSTITLTYHCVTAGTRHSIITSLFFMLGDSSVLELSGRTIRKILRTLCQ